MHRRTRFALAGVVAAGLSLGVASSAFAVSDPVVPPAPGEGHIPTKKPGCLRAIDRRVRDLAHWSTEISRRSNLDSTEKASLESNLAATSTALTSVAEPAVVAATTPSALATACAAIVTDYRVYTVVHPQVFLTAAADAWQHRLDTLQATATALSGGGKNISKVTPLLTQAQNLLSPIAPALAAVTPSSYDLAPRTTAAAFAAERRSLDHVGRLAHRIDELERHLARHH